MITLFEQQRMYIPVYNSEDYTSDEFSEAERCREIIDAWTRSARTPSDRSTVFINGVPLYRKLVCEDRTFEMDPKFVIQTLFKRNQVQPSKEIIDHVFAHANLDGFMGLLELLIKNQINQNFLGEIDFCLRCNFTTEDSGEVKYQEIVDILHGGKKVMTFQCDSVISVENGKIAHEVVDCNINTYNFYYEYRLFGNISYKALLVRIVNRIKRALSRLFSSGDSVPQTQPQPRFQR